MAINMEERLIDQVVGQVMIFDTTTKHWLPAGTSSGLSTVRLIHSLSNNSFRIHGQKIDGAKEVVLDNMITSDIKFNKANECFIRWHDKHAFWGLNFRPKPKGGVDEAQGFFSSIEQIMLIVGGSVTGQNHIVSQQQQHQQSQQMMVADHSNQQQNSASIIQRPIQSQTQIQHQQVQQQVNQPPILHQQQAQMMNMRLLAEQNQPQATILGQTQQAQIIQQQQKSNQPMLQQQQQMHAQYMQQQAQSHPNQNQMNHYQHAHQQHLQQQQPQQQPQQIRQPPPQPPIQQQQQQQLQQQSAQVVAAPVPPPPPPPPPPAPPIAGLSARVNGTSNSSNHVIPNNNNNNEAQHSPVSNNNSNNVLDRNGGSPSQQVSSLASELAKCQLKKVNLSRSDSEKESECNNNNVGNPKTTRAASLAYVPNNMLSELNQKLASRNKKDKLDQKGDTQSNCSTTSISNGISNDKGQESWLADLIRREINKEMTKMKAEILEAIDLKMRQR